MRNVGVTNNESFLCSLLIGFLSTPPSTYHRYVNCYRGTRGQNLNESERKRVNRYTIGIRSGYWYPLSSAPGLLYSYWLAALREGHNNWKCRKRKRRWNCFKNGQGV